MCSEYFKTRPILSDVWILLLEKLIFTSLAWVGKLKSWTKYKYLFTSWDFHRGKLNLESLVWMDKFCFENILLSERCTYSHYL